MDEKLLMLVMKDVVKTMLGEKKEKINSVSLSATTAKQKVLDIFHDVL